MNKYLPFYLIFLLPVFLTTCKEQDRTDSQKKDKRQLVIKSLDKISTAEKVDTLFAINAPARITRKIRKDKNGNLLIAAFEEVIRYDGETFSSIPKVPGIESLDAFDALEDSKGNIWIASTHHGVFRYDGKDFKHFTTATGLVHNRTMDIHEDQTGNIWIATMGGLSCYNGKSFRNYTTKEGLSHNDVNTIMEDRTGKIWLGTRGSACIYEPSTETFTEITRNGDIPFTNVWSIIEDNKNNIWLGAENGLWRYDGRLFTNFTREVVNCVFEDKKGNIWTTSPQGALKYYDEQSLLNEETSPLEIFRSDHMFFRVIEDKEGNIWLGTLKGILRYDGKGISYFKRNKNTTEYNVYDVHNF